MSRTRQWYYDGATIPGATGKTVVVGAGQLNAALWECRTQVDYGADSVAALAGIAGASAFSPLSLFASSEAGAWYDPSDLSTLYQDSVGTIPVTAAGQTVGLVLDKSQGAPGPELVPDGGFDAGTLPTGWVATPECLLAVVGGQLRATQASGSGAQMAYIPISTVIGKQYHFTGDFVSKTGSGRLYVGTGPGSTVHGQNPNAVRYGLIFTASTSTTYISVGEPAALGGDQLYDNFSLRELPGNHLTQATLASRPAYQTSGGLHWLESDGVDDVLVSVGNQTFTQPYTWIAGLEHITGASIGTGVFSAGSANALSTSADASGIYQRSDGAFRAMRAARRVGIGTGTVAQLTSAFTLGTPYVARANIETSPDQVVMRVGASSVTSAATFDGTAVTSSEFRIFHGITTASMKFFGGVVINRLLTTAEDEALVAILEAKSGVV